MLLLEPGKRRDAKVCLDRVNKLIKVYDSNEMSTSRAENDSTPIHTGSTSEPVHQALRSGIDWNTTNPSQYWPSEGTATAGPSAPKSGLKRRRCSDSGLEDIGSDNDKRREAQKPRLDGIFSSAAQVFGLCKQPTTLTGGHEMNLEDAFQSLKSIKGVDGEHGHTGPYTGQEVKQLLEQFRLLKVVEVKQDYDEHAEQTILTAVGKAGRFELARMAESDQAKSIEDLATLLICQMEPLRSVPALGSNDATSEEASKTAVAPSSHLVGKEPTEAAAIASKPVDNCGVSKTDVHSIEHDLTDPIQSASASKLQNSAVEEGNPAETNDESTTVQPHTAD